MSTNDRFLSNFGGLRANSLNHVLNNDNSDSLDGEPIAFKHSSYIDDDELIYQLKTKRNTFTILSLNCQSLNAKIYKIKILVEKYKYNQCFFGVICLQETWLSDDSDTSLIRWLQLDFTRQRRSCYIYLSDKYNYKLLSLHKYSEIWESQFIEVSGNKSKKRVVLGNVYRPLTHPPTLN